MIQKYTSKGGSPETRLLVKTDISKYKEKEMTEKTTKTRPILSLSVKKRDAEGEPYVGVAAVWAGKDGGYPYWSVDNRITLEQWIALYHDSKKPYAERKLFYNTYENKGNGTPSTKKSSAPTDLDFEDSDGIPF